MEVVRHERGTGLCLFRSFLWLDGPSGAMQNGLTSVRKCRFLGAHGEGILERVVSPHRFRLEVVWRVCRHRRQCQRSAYAKHRLLGQGPFQVRQKMQLLEKSPS